MSRSDSPKIERGVLETVERENQTNPKTDKPENKHRAGKRRETERGERLAIPIVWEQTAFGSKAYVPTYLLKSDLDPNQERQVVQLRKL